MKINKEKSLLLLIVFTLVVQSKTHPPKTHPPLPRKYKILCKLRPDLRICNKFKHGYQLRLRDNAEFEKQTRREQLIRDLTRVIKLKNAIKKLQNGKFDKRNEFKRSSEALNVMLADCLKSSVGRILGLSYCMRGRIPKITV